MENRYIFVIAKIGIGREIPDEESSGMKMLKEKVSQLQNFTPGIWYLLGGTSERYYTGTRPLEHPLTALDYNEIGREFAKERRMIAVYPLERSFTSSGEEGL